MFCFNRAVNITRWGRDREKYREQSAEQTQNTVVDQWPERDSNGYFSYIQKYNQSHK